MMNRPQPTTDRRTTSTDSSRALRRRFLGLVGGIGATLLAGCSAGPDAGGTGGGAGGASTPGAGGGADRPSGTFRLLISDQPVAIDEFDSLEVTFDSARVFGPTGSESDDEAPAETLTSEQTATETATQEGTETPDETETPTTTATDDETPTETPEADDRDGDDGGQGFSKLALDGATVDLTQVVGDKAIGVFEGELAAGKYTKIELFAADVEGIVGGESVDVMIPSGKLMITKSFEVRAGETLSFVFDINVVRRGRQGGYNLLPVISKSGVAGKDVEVQELGPDGRRPGDDQEDEDETPEEEPSDGDGPPENPGSAGGGGPPNTSGSAP